MKDKGSLAFVIFSLWLFLGPPILGERFAKRVWHGSFVSKNRKKDLEDSLCLFWILWQERNQRYFDGIQCSDQALKDSLICTLFHWIRLHIQEGPSSWVDFIDWLCVS